MTRVITGTVIFKKSSNTWLCMCNRTPTPSQAYRALWDGVLAPESATPSSCSSWSKPSSLRSIWDSWHLLLPLPIAPSPEPPALAPVHHTGLSPVLAPVPPL